MAAPKKFYKRGRNFRDKVGELYEKGIVRGLYCGFENLYDCYSVQPGSTTYIYGAPFSGKSEFWFELLLNLTELHGLKHAIFSPETGTPEEIAAELISKKCRKPFYKQIQGCLTESELMRELDWFDEYFFIVDPTDDDLTIPEFYNQIDLLEKDFDVKINTTLCDPFNEIKHDFSEEGRQDLYIENQLGFIRRNAKKHTRHNAILTHASKQEQIKGRDMSGKDKWFYPPPAPRQIAGGEAWYRKAMMLLGVWRAPDGLVDDSTGMPYKSNEVHVYIQKFKPKFTGKKAMIKLYYDIEKNRHYEKINGMNRYAASQHKLITPIQTQAEYEF